jgi:branched-chain amino acid transport system ATP-binding protein
MPVTAVLEARNLSRRFGPITVADDLSFAVARGECLGIIGPNGAGKTSVFNILAGVVAPQAGQVLIEGRDVTTLPQFARTRAGLGRTYQVPQPFGMMSAYENVLTAASFGGGLSGRAAGQRAAEILQRTGLAGRSDSMAGALGLLDRKRLELARALALAPKVLLLDEIAGGLTEAEVGQLVALIRAIKSDLAIIWIEHVLHALSAVADRVIAINFGRQIAQGSPAAILADPAVQEVYMGTVLNAAS